MTPSTLKKLLEKLFYYIWVIENQQGIMITNHLWLNVFIILFTSSEYLGNKQISHGPEWDIAKYSHEWSDITRGEAECDISSRMRIFSISHDGICDIWFIPPFGHVAAHFRFVFNPKHATIVFSRLHNLDMIPSNWAYSRWQENHLLY